MLTWVDLLALLSLSLGLALGVRAGLPFLGAGLGVLLYLLLAAAGLGGWGWALGLGLLLGALFKSLPLPPLSPLWERVLGGLGGGVLGLFLALVLWTAFPFEVLPGSGVRYPSLRLPTPVYEGVGQSPFARAAFRWAWETPWARRALGLEHHP